MRPVTLTMKAFGSFAQETTVPFSEFQNGLYLIVGETGAGKTTVFDAIVFALYGVASGTNRRPDMMHSDYVEKSEDTFVRLVFEQHGKRYTVERNLHFRKKRGTGSEYGDATPDAVLTSPDEPPVRGHAAVTRRCEALLGLNADQFRKIVMLAQGEFREFLAADAARKSEILGRLFDSSEYIRYQNLLSQARATLAARRKQTNDVISTVMTSVFMAPEEEEPYLPGDPQLVARLDELIASDTRRAEALNAQQSAAQQAVDALNTKIGAAERDNRLLTELAGANEHQQALNDRREAMARLGQEYALAERAWHRVFPAKEKHQAAADACRQTRLAIDALRGNIARFTENRDRAQDIVNGDSEVKARILTIHAKEQKLEESLPQYTALEERLSALNESGARAARLKEKLNQANARQLDLADQLEQRQGELAALENAEAEAARAASQHDRAREDAAEWANVQTGIQKALDDEASVQQDAHALVALTRKASDAEKAYHLAYQAFVNGQAGLLANELEQALSETGRAVCPVCRSVFHAGQAHDFAPLAQGTPSQLEVDSARERFDRCERQRNDQQTAIAQKQTALDGDRQHLLDLAQKLLPDVTEWTQLSDPTARQAAAARFTQTEQETLAAFQAAQRRMSRRKELKRCCETLSGELVALTHDSEEAKNALIDAEKTVSALSAEADVLKRALPYPTREAVLAERARLKQEYDMLNGQVTAHEQALDAARKALDQAQGELSALLAALPAQETAERDTAQAFRAALAANGLADAAALDAALAPMGQADREDWLGRQAEAINAYRNDCVNTENRVRELTAQTRDLTYTDLDTLRQQIAMAGEARDAVHRAVAELNGRLSNHTDVRRRVASAFSRLAAANDAWQRLDRLAELATGSSAEGGKLSFERYVMGAIFREVLEMANRRLDIMSGGRYALVHTTNAGRVNAAAGLEIEVLDAATGRQRAANSLSGGESFQVSLSLALGLSDVVQSHAGGIALDTLFIDEGFGALDSGALDNAIKVLNQLTEGRRLVGIISHVDKLEESIPQKLRVRKTPHGSEIRPELS